MACPGKPTKAPTDDTKMMRPLCSRSILATARLATRNDPVRLASITSRKACSLMRSISASPVIPALATSTSTGLQRSSMAAIGRLDVLAVADVAAHRQEAVLAHLLAPAEARSDR